MSSGGQASSVPGPRAGAKRPSDESVNNEQPLAKRFHLLNLDNEDQGLWVPKNGNNKDCASYEFELKRTADEFSAPMQIDETKHRIYIHDLDEELDVAEDVPPDDRVIFLPDIEKKLNHIPPHILRGVNRPGVAGNELVLYGVPRSLNVPTQHDSVRKTIAETSPRASEKSRNNSSTNDPKREPGKSATAGSQQSFKSREANEDAMDIG